MLDAVLADKRRPGVAALLSGLLGQLTGSDYGNELKCRMNMLN